MLWKFSTASLELRDRLRSYGGIALMLNLLTVIPQQSVRYVPILNEDLWATWL